MGLGLKSANSTLTAHPDGHLAYTKNSTTSVDANRLEAQAGVETRMPTAVATDIATQDPAQPKAGTLTTPRRKRRAYTPNFMRD